LSSDIWVDTSASDTGSRDWNTSRRRRSVMSGLGVEAESVTQFSGGDGLIGVVSSWDLSRVGETWYALVVTTRQSRF
jgi:hypothetical protein